MPAEIPLGQPVLPQPLSGPRSLEMPRWRPEPIGGSGASRHDAADEIDDGIRSGDCIADGDVVKHIGLDELHG